MGAGSHVRMLRVASLLFVASVASLGFLWACAPALSGSSKSSGTGMPASSDPALDAGRVLVESTCTLCHTLDRIKSANHDASGWESTVSRMRSNGAVLTDSEAKSIVGYLASR